MYHRGLRRAQKDRIKAPLLALHAQDILDDQKLELRYAWYHQRYAEDDERREACQRMLRHRLRNEGKTRCVDGFVPKFDTHRDGWGWDGHRVHAQRRESAAQDDHLRLWEQDYLNPQDGDGPYGDPVGMDN